VDGGGWTRSVDDEYQPVLATNLINTDFLFFMTGTAR